MLAEPGQAQGIREVVANTDPDARAFRHANEGRRRCQRCSAFAEGLDVERRAGIAFGAPCTRGCPQLQGEDAVGDRTRRTPIVIGQDVIRTVCARVLVRRSHVLGGGSGRSEREREDYGVERKHPLVSLNNAGS